MVALLVAKGISKSYGKTRALVDVNLAIEHAEIHGLVGENGAGKSTLAKIIAGDVPCDNGEIIFENTVIPRLTPRRAREVGIAIVHQSGELAPNLTVLENIFLGSELHGPLRILNKRAMRKRAQEILNEFQVDIDLDTPVGQLPTTCQQIVAIAKALSLESKLLIVDEGGASLDRRSLSELFRILRHLRNSGISILYISHLLDNVLALSDRVTVLRDGRIVTTQPVEELSVERLATLITGRERLGEAPAICLESEHEQEDLLRVENLRWAQADRSHTFSVRKSEILGITGPTGAGKSELLRSIFGLEARKGGTVLVCNEARWIRPRNPYRMVRKGVAFVPEERYEEGLLLNRSIEENVSLPNLYLWYRFLISKRQLKKRANQACLRARVKMASIHEPVIHLSGGNQQKVVIAKWLASTPAVFLLDEPFRGIDIGAKADIRNVIHELAKKGCAVVIASTEFNDLLGLVHRLFVMVNHRIVAELTDGEITSSRIMQFYQMSLDEGGAK